MAQDIVRGDSLGETPVAVEQVGHVVDVQTDLEGRGLAGAVEADILGYLEVEAVHPGGDERAALGILAPVAAEIAVAFDELLEGSKYKDCFKGGQWTHSFLNTNDYHRQHAPVAGRIVEARVIQGTTYVNITAEPVPGQPGKNQIKHEQITAPDTAGYEFMQTRGCIIIDSPIGLVGVLPIGMSNVSSVIITAEEGRTLHKGEEISYFQFGGSDYCMVFQEHANVSFTAQPGVHYKVGTRIAVAEPVVGLQRPKIIC